MIPSVLLAWVLVQASAASQTGLPPATVALVETYADGRVVYEFTTAKPAHMWTPRFPRVTGILRNALTDADSRPDVLAWIAAQIEALPAAEETQLADAQASMRAARAAALNDLRRLEQDAVRGRDATAIKLWLQETITRYEGAIARLAQ